MSLPILTEEEASAKEASRFRKWQTKMSKFVRSKPIYLLGIHGGYNYEDMVFSAPVPANSMIIEMTFMTEYATCLLGANTGGLSKLLQNPRVFASVLTAPMGTTFARRDVDLLAQSSKYIDGDRYYPRSIQLNRKDSENTEFYYIIKYFDKSQSHVRNAVEWLVDRTEKKIVTSIDQLIHFIELNDPDASGGAIFINTSCAYVNKSDKRITKELLWRLIEHQESHKSLYRKTPLRSFIYKPLSRRKYPNNSVPPLRIEGEPRSVNVKPTASFFTRKPYKYKYIGLHIAPKSFTGTTKKRTYMTHMLETVNEEAKGSNNTKKSSKSERFMIKINNVIFNKKGKTVFTYKEALPILRELKRILEPTAQIEIYSSTERRWSLFTA
jgi:hypothetical protein